MQARKGYFIWRDAAYNARMEKLAVQPGPPLPGDDIHLWEFTLEQPATTLEQLETTLAADELERASRFVFHEHRVRFLAAHGIMRAVLALYARVEPAQLSFVCGPYGKPALARGPGQADIDFNLSHTLDEGLLAVSQGHPIGVDIERLRDNLEYAAVAERFFSPAEVASLLGLPERLRQQAFFRCWTRKEAFIKAIGRGLFAQLDSFDVSLAPDEPPCLRATRPDPAEAEGWRLYEVEVPDGCAGALAVWGGARGLAYFHWPPA